MKLFGSGWVWLVDNDGFMEIMPSPNSGMQQKKMSHEIDPTTFPNLTQVHQPDFEPWNQLYVLIYGNVLTILILKMIERYF
ncbi:Fe-Mn family superoxide dismutase [Patescibacteria group bacterium]|nr:Fe-Mn family superoxide dismutase [Patescibacteria group bacterium]